MFINTTVSRIEAKGSPLSLLMLIYKKQIHNFHIDISRKRNRVTQAVAPSAVDISMRRASAPGVITSRIE